MAFTSTSAILDSLKSRIGALTPSSQVNEDDVFRVRCEESDDLTGSRQVELTASGGKRKQPGRTCVDWESTIQIQVIYAYTPAEPGQQTTHQRAVTDAEDILDDLYTWAVETDGINKIDPDFANIQDDGQGFVTSTRTLLVEYQRA